MVKMVKVTLFLQLYHACDQDVFSFCLIKYSVLQFCDYFAATMAYWVTVLAMGGLPDQAKSLLHMAGALGIALGIEYDRSGVFTFLVPGVAGLIILLAAWVRHTFHESMTKCPLQISHCTNDRDCYPGAKYLCCFFLPGVAVFCGGLFVFVALEGDREENKEESSNYQFLHSAWQASMAISILFLLPQAPPAEKDPKYAIIDATRANTAYNASVESSFKHYADDGPGVAPEVINVTSSGGAGLIDQVIDVSRAPSLATLNNVGAVSSGTLPRGATMPNRASGGTLKRQQQQQPAATATMPPVSQVPPHQQYPYEPG